MDPTRCEIGGKVRLVVVIKEYKLSQSSHSKHLTKSLPSLTLAPGAKTRIKCAWWAGFGPHQVRKPGKSAPGGQVLDPTRCEIGGKVHLVGIGLQIYSGCYHAGGHCHLKNGKLFMYAEASLFFWWQHPIVATSILSARIKARYPPNLSHLKNASTASSHPGRWLAAAA